MKAALSTVAVAVLPGLFAVACAHQKGSLELSAQDSIGSDQGASAPAQSSSPAPGATATDGQGTAAPPAATVSSVPSDAPSCPLHCVIATPRHRTLAPDEEDRLRTAFAPTMSGLRQCVYGDHYDGRRVRPPALTLRFASAGDLLDVGVDTTGWAYAAESCFQQVARGGAGAPDVRLEGPATVRCAERCERATTTTKRVKKK